MPIGRGPELTRELPVRRCGDPTKTGQLIALRDLLPAEHNPLPFFLSSRLHSSPSQLTTQPAMSDKVLILSAADVDLLTAKLSALELVSQTSFSFQSTSRGEPSAYAETSAMTHRLGSSARRCLPSPPTRASLPRPTRPLRSKTRSGSPPLPKRTRRCTCHPG